MTDRARVAVAKRAIGERVRSVKRSPGRRGVYNRSKVWQKNTVPPLFSAFAIPTWSVKRVVSTLRPA